MRVRVRLGGCLILLLALTSIAGAQSEPGTIRGAGSDVPVLMLTARDAVDARVEGLGAGADGYLTKPFEFRELVAGVRALFALLEFLVRRAGEVVGRADIAEHVWDEHYEPFSNAVDLDVQRLRKKLDEAQGESFIRTRRGLGYQLL